MRSSSRWLFAFGIAIVVLAAVAVVLVLTTTGNSSIDLLPEDTPEGTVQRYLLATEAGDYEKAYSYLSPSAVAREPYYSSYEKWSQGFFQNQRQNTWRATLGKSVITDNRATVVVTIDVFRPDAPFVNLVNTYYYSFILQKEEAFWRIISPVYPLYFY
jgi:hypothetical protein